MVQRAVTTLVSTTAVERKLGEVRLTELKHRANLLGAGTLEACVKLNLQTLSGRRIGNAMDPDMLVRGAEESAERNVRYRISPYGIQVQNTYRDYFGEKSSKGRFLVAEANRLDEEKPKLNPMRPAGKRNTLRAAKERHNKAFMNTPI